MVDPGIRAHKNGMARGEERIIGKEKKREIGLVRSSRGERKRFGEKK